MKFQPGDLHKLRWHLAFAIGLTLVSVFLAWAATQFGKSVHQENLSATARFTASEEKWRQVRSEEQEIRDKAALFADLRKRGIVGPENRLEWTEKLRQIQHELRLPDMRYEFSPQSPLENGSPGTYAYFSSPMKLHLALIHEGDLLNFLNRLQREVPAHVLVRSCKVNRASGGNQRANLGADCEMEWITLHPSKGN